MNTVTQKMKFRQSLIKYSEKHGVTKAAIKYNVTRQYIIEYFRKRFVSKKALKNIEAEFEILSHDELIRVKTGDG